MSATLLEAGLVARYLSGMPRRARKDGLDNVRRYRASQKRRGMKLVRLWVPDPKAPGFRRQALLLRGALEEREALDCIEAVASFSD